VAVFSPLCVLGFFVEDQSATDAWVYIWIFYSDPLVFLSVFVPMPCCFYFYGSVLLFEVSIVMPPALEILLRIALAIPGLLCFHMYS
jgi:hypothetical protein